MKLNSGLHATNNNSDLIQILVFAMLVLLFLPGTNFGSDAAIWIAWADFYNSNSFTDAYNSTFINYPPIYLYILKIFSVIFPSEAEIAANIKWIKVFPFIFDLLPLVALLIFYKDIKHLKWSKYLLLFNIGYLYNTLFWGQVDSVHNTFIVLAILFLFRWPLVSASLLVFAFNSKIQTLSALPVIAVAYIPYIRTNKFNILKLVAAVVVTWALILTPFIYRGVFHKYIQMMTDSVGYFSGLSVNAPNIWSILMEGDLYSISSLETFMGVSYRSWGLIMFFVSSGIAILPLLILSVTKTNKAFFQNNTVGLIALICGITNLTFFFFNAEMHERYCHGCMILFFIFGVFSRKWDLFLLTSFIYFFNLEGVTTIFKLDYSIFLFNRDFMAYVYLAILILSFFRLYNASVELGIAGSIRQIKSWFGIGSGQEYRIVGVGRINE